MHGSELAWLLPAITAAFVIRQSIHQGRIARLVDASQPGREIETCDAMRAEDRSATVFVVGAALAGALLWLALSL